MPTHVVLQLNLLENSFDYLAASLEAVIKNRSTWKKGVWKFAFLNMAFAIELLLKERLRKENEFLIYADLERYKKITRETKTVSWNVLIERLHYVLGDKLIELDGGRLQLAQTMRNQFLHYDVRLDFDTAYHDYANLLNFYTRFYNEQVRESEADTLHRHIPPELWRDQQDLSEAFVDEIIYYNGLFMRKDYANELILEQENKILIIEGKEYERIPFAPPKERLTDGDYFAWLCHDCWAAPGQIHMLGCDVEICPKCSNLQQLISCGCDYKYKMNEQS